MAASSATTNQKLSQEFACSLVCGHNNCAGMVIGDLRLVYLIFGLEAVVIITVRFLEYNNAGGEEMGKKGGIARVVPRWNSQALMKVNAKC